MVSLSQARNPVGAALLVQYLYGKHYPLKYQLPYQFVYRKKVLQVESVRMKYVILKFLPPIISFCVVGVCTVGIYCLSLQEQFIFRDLRFWAWICFSLIGSTSMYVFIVDALHPRQLVQVWKETVDFYLHITKGNDTWNNGANCLSFEE